MHRIIITWLVLFVCFVLYVFFPAPSPLHAIIKAFFFLCLLPVLFFKFVLQIRPFLHLAFLKQYTKKDFFLIFITTVLSTVSSITTLFFLSKAGIISNYPPQIVQGSFAVFLTFEIFVISVVAMLFFFSVGLVAPRIWKKGRLYATGTAISLFSMLVITDFSIFSQTPIALTTPYLIGGIFATVATIATASIFAGISVIVFSVLVCDALSMLLF